MYCAGTLGQIRVLCKCAKVILLPGLTGVPRLPNNPARNATTAKESGSNITNKDAHKCTSIKTFPWYGELLPGYVAETQPHTSATLKLCGQRQEMGMGTTQQQAFEEIK